MSNKVSVDSREAAPGVLLDFDAEGHVIGIDIDRASEIVDLSRLGAEAVPIHHAFADSKKLTPALHPMAEKVKLWFDADADYLEARFREAPGFMRSTAHDAVMERVDEQGHVLWFSVIGVSRFRMDHPLEAERSAKEDR